jgi:ribosomal protein S18 acetylase RimI-like enzyme
MTLFMRPATKEDAIFAAARLAETNGEFGVEVLGLGNPNLQHSALQQWFGDSGNRFSFQCSTIAEKDGTPAGLLLAFHGSDLSGLELGCAKRILGIYGFFGTVKMIWLNKSLANNKEAEKDEYLIAHLAVDEGFRRQGIAQALLDKAGQDARSLRLNKLVLEVEIGNEKAINLYQKADFEIVNTVYFNEKTDRFKCPGFYKMLKNL